MVCRLLKLFLLFAIACCSLGDLAGQPPAISRIWAVKDGLPQSYVSGIFQDRAGFLWISTLNGFCRCDGRTFKYYRHTYTDSSSLGGNIILYLFDIGSDRLVLCYIDGRIEEFNTITEKITPLWKEKAFDVLRPESPWFRSLVGDRKGTGWMMANDGGIFHLDLNAHSVKHFTWPELHLPGPVEGLALTHDSLVLFTKTQLSLRDPAAGLVKTIANPSAALSLFETDGGKVCFPVVRSNGDIIIADSIGVKIWNTGTGFFKSVPFTRPERRGKLVAILDQAGNCYFESRGGIDLLRADNTLVEWSAPDPAAKGIVTTMYIDQSGVLWAGTNGYGLRQYNLLKTGVHGYASRYSFVIDVLSHYGLSQSSAGQAKTFLTRSVPFANRSASFNGSVWISDINQSHNCPTLALFSNRRLSEITFHDEDPLSKNPSRKVIFLAFTRKGVLWGIDQHFALLRFNIQRHTFRAFRHLDLDPEEEFNGMVADGESSFYLTTTRNLVQADTLGRTQRLSSLLPSKELLTVTHDQDDDNILWIGTLSDGLIRLDRTTQRAEVFSMATGLPNNTVYSIVEGNDHQLWCSSNKGIFAFDRKLHTVRPFTSRDGLVDDEFNRFYYMTLPGGDLAFGGPMGYTLFNPSKLVTDDFDPPLTLTGLEVINRPRQDSELENLSELPLRYDQNFITAEFAAMQFDFPEKLQYRHRLEGFDKAWVLTGNDNKVYYTSLPPGHYTLLLNASNTGGRWGSHIRRIGVSVAPPFWRTGWFYASAVLLVGLLFYFLLHTRISSLKKAHSQQLEFEREAMKLHAMALRARMNPHFIFNCLNSIKALIQEKEDKKAITYLTTFVTLIRKQLSNTGDKISLQEELDTCRLYLRLEAMRFDGRIAYEFDIADTVLPQQVMVPPLILQPVIENAVVHGLIPVEHGGLIRVRVYREDRTVTCSIEDNGIGRAASSANHRKSSRLHESKGVHMLEQRILIHNRLNEFNGSMDTIDLYEPGGEPSGTRVVFKFDAQL